MQTLYIQFIAKFDCLYKSINFIYRTSAWSSPKRDLRPKILLPAGLAQIELNFWQGPVTRYSHHLSNGPHWSSEYRTPNQSHCQTIWSSPWVIYANPWTPVHTSSDGRSIKNDCCVFQLAFGCCSHLKAGRNTLKMSSSQILFVIKPMTWKSA